MRKIEFRGYSKTEKKWIYGFINIVKTIENKTGYWIENELGATPVDKQSIGQFTGQKDSFENKIFEGDLIRQTIKGKDKKGTNFVSWDEICCLFYIKRKREIMYQFPLSQYIGTFKVIGNIYENPEF